MVERLPVVELPVKPELQPFYNMVLGSSATAATSSTTATGLKKEHGTPVVSPCHPPLIIRRSSPSAVPLVLTMASCPRLALTVRQEHLVLGLEPAPCLPSLPGRPAVPGGPHAR